MLTKIVLLILVQLFTSLYSDYDAIYAEGLEKSDRKVFELHKGLALRNVTPHNIDALLTK